MMLHLVSHYHTVSLVATPGILPDVISENNIGPAHAQSLRRLAISSGDAVACTTLWVTCKSHIPERKKI
jgi:hypothetical protein